MYRQLSKTLPLVGRYLDKAVRNKTIIITQDKSNVMVLSFSKHLLRIVLNVDVQYGTTNYKFMLSVRTDQFQQNVLFSMTSLVRIDDGVPNAGDQLNLIGAITAIINKTSA